MSNKLVKNNRKLTPEDYMKKGGNWFTYGFYVKMAGARLVEGGTQIVMRPNQKSAGIWKKVNGTMIEESIEAA